MIKLYANDHILIQKVSGRRARNFLSFYILAIFRPHACVAFLQMHFSVAVGGCYSYTYISDLVKFAIAVLFVNY